MESPITQGTEVVNAFVQLNKLKFRYGLFYTLNFAKIIDFIYFYKISGS